MPFDGSGAYSPPSPPTFPAVSGNTISSTYFNATVNDLANALSTALCRDGQSTVTADISLNAHKLIEVADPTNPQDAATKFYVDAEIDTVDAAIAAITANYAKLTLTVRNAYTLAASGSIPVDTTDLFYGLASNIRLTSDAAVSTASPGDQIPSASNVSHYFGGATVNDGRNALSAHLHMTGATSATNAYRYYAAGYFVADTAYNDGGVLGTPAGTLYGLGAVSWLKPGATYWRASIGLESNVCVEATVTAPLIVSPLVSLPWPDHAVHGTLVDAGLWVSTGSTTGFLNGLQIDDNGGHFPIETTGTVMKVTGAGTPTVSQGIDLSGISITNFMLRGNGVVSTTSTSSATSVTTGAVRVGGGVGVAGNIAYGGLEITLSKTVVAPADGATVTLGATTSRTIINPVGALAALTVALPTAVADGDLRHICFTKAITTLTWTGTTSGFPGTIAANTVIRAIWDTGTSTWFLA